MGTSYVPMKPKDLLYFKEVNIEIMEGGLQCSSPVSESPSGSGLENTIFSFAKNIDVKCFM